MQWKRISCEPELNVLYLVSRLRDARTSSVNTPSVHCFISPFIKPIVILFTSTINQPFKSHTQGEQIKKNPPPAPRPTPKTDEHRNETKKILTTGKNNHHRLWCNNARALINKKKTFPTMQHKNEGFRGGAWGGESERCENDHRSPGTGKQATKKMSKSNQNVEKTQLKNQKNQTRGGEGIFGSRSVLTSAGRVPERGRGLGQPVVYHRLRLPRQVDRGGWASACRTQHREQSVHTGPPGSHGGTGAALGGSCRLSEGELEEAGHSGWSSGSCRVVVHLRCTLVFIYDESLLKAWMLNSRTVKTFGVSKILSTTNLWKASLLRIRGSSCLRKIV